MEVEVDIAKGLPSFTMVGLAETSVRESRERVKAAITNSGYVFPPGRITVNLAPAHIRKEGTGFDLPIACGILAASDTIPGDALGGYLMLGELALDGRVKPVAGALSMAMAARNAGIAGIILPEENSLEAAVVSGLSVFPVKHLSEAVGFLCRAIEISPVEVDPERELDSGREMPSDFSEVAGQEHVKRALEVAAAGGHNLIMVGPPGSGKTMLARRFAGIIPPMTLAEALEVTRVYSVAGLMPGGSAIVSHRPFRSPHHTISDAGLIGGGGVPKPGEVSLAHMGVLFLDELPEFKKSVLEVLRQPLEDRCVTISRASASITFPADFMLIAAMNPCPCGYHGDPSRECTCSAYQVQRYRSRISGPLADRIDIHVEVPAVTYRDLAGRDPGEPSASIRKRVTAARKIQGARFAGSQIKINAGMSTRHIRKYCPISKKSAALLEKAVDRLGLSARAYHRVLKIARTIADLEGSDGISSAHILEALQYRGLDRRYSGGRLGRNAHGR